MAQATGIQALGRAAQLLDEPKYAATARRALGAFETPRPPACARPARAGGVRYLQYSFAPRLYIFNAFLQSLIGLYDFSKLTGDARARALYDDAEPEARAEVPLQRRGRLVALQLRRPRVEPRLPRAAARVPREHVHAPPGRRSTASTRSATAATRSTRPVLDYERPGDREGGPAGRAPLQRVEAVGRGGDRYPPRRAAWCSTGSPPSGAAPARSRGAARAGHLHRAAGGEGAAHRPRQARQRPRRDRGRGRASRANCATDCAAR